MIRIFHGILALLLTLSANQALRAAVEFDNLTPVFQENFESAANINELRQPNGPWHIGWGIYSLRPEDNADNIVLTNASNTSANPLLNAGEPTWEDQALKMRFRWNGDFSQHYLWTMSVRSNEGRRYRLYATNPSSTGDIQLHLQRDGYESYFTEALGLSDWNSYLANIMDDSELSGLPPSQTLSYYTLTPRLALNTWHEVMLRAVDGYLQVYINNQAVPKLVHDHFGIHSSGSIGIGLAKGVELDDITVFDWADSAAILAFDYSLNADAVTQGQDIQVVQGTPLTLTWQTLNAQKVRLTANGELLTEHNPAGAHKHNDIIVTPSINTQYVLEAEGKIGTERRLLDVNVTTGSAFAYAKASREVILPGQAVTLSWASSGATHVEIEGIPETLPATGEYTFTPQGSKTFTLKAIGNANQATATIHVEVGEIAGVDFAPYVLPNLEDIGSDSSLILQAHYKLTSGRFIPIQAPITWRSSHPDLVVVNNGKITLIDHAPTHPVTITAIVEGVQYDRTLYPKYYLLDDNTPLFSNGGFEQNNPINANVWDGNCQHQNDSTQAATGEYAYRLSCDANGRVAVFFEHTLAPGHYRLSATIQGAGIAEEGLWGNDTALTIRDSVNDTTLASEPLLHGTFGWTAIERDFTIEHGGTHHFYLQLYAPGILWIDDVRLSPIDQTETTDVRISTNEAPAPSLCALDTDECRGAQRTLEPHDISGFKTRSLAPFSVSQGIAHFESTTNTAVQGPVNAQAAISPQMPNDAPNSKHGAVELQLEEGGGWISATAAAGLLSDWGGYHFLTFSLTNHSTVFTDFSVEIHDEESTGYWSRVNWNDKLAPGINHFRIPLQTFVGERIQTAQARRLITDKITKLVIAIREQGSYTLSELTLTQDANRCTRPSDLHAFDFGPSHSPVQTGFTEINGLSQYAACRGYGLVGNGQWALEDNRSPDNLWRDWISFRADQEPDFQLDLPSNTYSVKVYWEDPGYWEWYPNFTQRQIYMEDVLVCDERTNYETFLETYFAHEFSEDTPWESTWDKYIQPRYQAGCSTDITVTDGQLNIAFSGAGPRIAAINGLVVYPKNSHNEAEAWLTQQEAQRKAAFNYDYRKLDIAAISEPQQNDATSTQIFHRPLDKPIYLNSSPTSSEHVTTLPITALHNQRAVSHFAIKPAQDLGTIISAKIDGLPANITTEWYSVEHQLQRLTPDGNVYASQPTILNPIHGTSLLAHQARQIFIALTLPPQASGTLQAQHSLTLSITTDRGHEVSLAATLSVVPMDLPESNIRHSVMGVFPLYTGGAYATQLQQKSSAEMPAVLAILKPRGLNAVMGVQPVSGNAGECDTAAADKLIQTLQALEFSPLIHTYSSLPGIQHGNLMHYFSNRHSANSANSATDTTALINCTAQTYQNAGFELAWSLFDEPDSTAKIGNILQAAQWYKTLPLAVPFKTAGFSSITGEGDIRQARNTLFEATDYPMLTRLEASALERRQIEGRPWGTYNHNTRFGFGVFAWVMAEQYGLTDVSSFATHSMQSDHYYPLDSREADLAYIYTGKSGQVRASVPLENLAMGIQDYRILLALKNAVADNPDHPAAKEAQAFLASILKRYTVEMYNEEIAHITLDKLRQEAINFILKL